MKRLSALALIFAIPALASEANLLAGKVPIKAEGVSDAQRITDGLAAPEGDDWKSSRTSVIAPNGFVVWDLGEAKPVRAALLQGDNNDDYLLEGSLDGNAWFTLWSVHTVSDPGMRLRAVSTLGAQTRYVRLTVRGGDSSYSVGEIELHPTPETLTASSLKRQRGRSNESPPLVLWALTIGAVAYLVSLKQKPLWVLGSPLLAALGWASLTSLLDLFVG